jgi:hypothetical protein
MTLVAADWRPHVYTDSELDQLERDHSGSLEDFSAVVCRAFRRHRMRSMIKVGSTVTVQLDSGRKIQGVVKAVYDSVSGRKFQVSSGSISVKVEEGQIISE